MIGWSTLTKNYSPENEATLNSLKQFYDSSIPTVRTMKKCSIQTFLLAMVPTFFGQLSTYSGKRLQLRCVECCLRIQK